MTIRKVIKNKVLMAIIIVLIIASAVMMLPEIEGQYIKRFGIEISPKIEIAPIYDSVYMQTDDRWKDEHLAQTDYTLAQQGCLTCVIAMDLCYYGYEVNPTDVNDKLISADAYTDDGLLIWYKINDAYEDIEYDYKKNFKSGTIDEDLENGLLPIVKVRYKKTGIFHWVLIVGAQESDYLILDPLEKSQGPIPLSTHGKVYAYRVLRKTSN
ncbi:MAG: hypothetical protein AB1Z23_05235 [Eubacteriales bacterium]